jgi:hypothetical protein
LPLTTDLLWRGPAARLRLLAGDSETNRAGLFDVAFSPSPARLFAQLHLKIHLARLHFDLGGVVRQVLPRLASQEP